MHAAAVGRAMLAEMDDALLTGILHKKGMPRFTDKTIADPAALRRELAHIRERGWAVDDEEHTVRMRCVPATLHNPPGHPIAGLSLSGPPVRVPHNRLGPLGPPVAPAATALPADAGRGLPHHPP